MVISNFKMIKKVKGNSGDYQCFAEIDVTTGFWWWKKTVTRPITIPFHEQRYWYFMDDGELVDIDALKKPLKVYTARYIFENGG